MSAVSSFTQNHADSLPHAIPATKSRVSALALGILALTPQFSHTTPLSLNPNINCTQPQKPNFPNVPTLLHHSLFYEKLPNTPNVFIQYSVLNPSHAPFELDNNFRILELIEWESMFQSHLPNTTSPTCNARFKAGLKVLNEVAENDVTAYTQRLGIWAHTVLQQATNNFDDPSIQPTENNIDSQLSYLLLQSDPNQGTIEEKRAPLTNLRDRIREERIEALHKNAALDFELLLATTTKKILNIVGNLTGHQYDFTKKCIDMGIEINAQKMATKLVKSLDKWKITCTPKLDSARVTLKHWQIVQDFLYNFVIRLKIILGREIPQKVLSCPTTIKTGV